MNWRSFEQGWLPSNRVFLIRYGDRVLFAKSYGSFIVTSDMHTHVDYLSPKMIVKFGTEIPKYLDNLKKSDIVPRWAHLHL